mgnify:CR=1 FL=1
MYYVSKHRNPRATLQSSVLASSICWWVVQDRDKIIKFTIYWLSLCSTVVGAMMLILWTIRRSNIFIWFLFLFSAYFSLPGPRRLEGQVVIVTGASSGIGSGLARGLAKEGAKVALAARRLDRWLTERNSPCSKREENWVWVGTAKHQWIDWMGSRFVNNNNMALLSNPINP